MFFNRRNLHFLFIGKGYLTVILALFSAYILSYKSGQYTICPLFNITGLPCPGCGSIRAVNTLFHFKLPQALLYNPFAVLLLISSIIYLIIRTSKRLSEITFMILVKNIKIVNRFFLITAVLWIIYGLVRLFLPDLIIPIKPDFLLINIFKAH